MLGAAAPTLIFPGNLTWLGLGLIIATWLARRFATGRWSVRTRIDGATLVLSGALLLSLAPSVRLDYSLPKFWGIVLGLTGLYACLNMPRSPGALRRAEFLLLLAGAAIAVLGAVGMIKPPNKLLDERIYAALPHLVTSVRSSTSVSQGIHPNELAGTLLLLIPLSLALSLRRDPMRWMALIACALMLAVVVLSQSRAAIFGLAAAASVGMLAWSTRRRIVTRLSVSMLVIGCLLIGIAASVGNGQRPSGQSSATSLESLPGRIELWQRGLAMALDMPFTGIGLNTFPIILRTYYPTVFSGEVSLVPHAHDLYLQTLLDLGLFGLVSFVAIVGSAVGASMGVALRAPGTRHLTAGLLLGLLAHGVFSVVDAVALGAKPGLLLWITLGLLLVVGDHHAPAATSPSSRGRWHARVARLRAPLRSLGQRPATWALSAVVVAPLCLAGASVNAAHVLLHRAAAVNSPILVADLHFAGLFAPDPLAARVASAQALQSELGGDLPSAIAALAKASQRGGWDRSLALRLGDLRAAAGDRDGAIQAWRSAHAVDLLIARADASPQERLQWFNLAAAVDPTDWRPYVRAADMSDPPQAAAYIARALNARGDEPARRDVANRLLDPLAPLPAQLSAPASPQDANLFMYASRILLAAGDLPGGIVSAQLATLSAPEQEVTWIALADALERAGSPTGATRARAQAALAH